MNDIQTALESRSIAKFHHDSTSAISTFVREIEGSTQTSNHIHLAATEYAVATNFDQGYNAVEVRRDSAILAIMHYNCKTQIRICRGIDHRPDFGYFDMTVFSADACRLEYLIGNFDNLQGNPSLLGRTARQLVENYVQSSMTHRAVEMNIPVTQALIWYLQLSVANYPGYAHEDLESAVGEGLEEIRRSYWSE